MLHKTKVEDAELDHVAGGQCYKTTSRNVCPIWSDMQMREGFNESKLPSDLCIAGILEWNSNRVLI